MAQKGAVSSLVKDLYRGGMTPFERAGSIALSREPGVFDYGALEQKYPTTRVTPIIPSYIQRELEEQELERKQAELENRRLEAQINIYDSQLNQEREMMSQVPIARKALAGLNPADEDFIVKLSEVQNQTPLAFENQQFSQYLVAPLIRRHEMIQQNNMIIQRGSAKKEETAGLVTEKDLQGAAIILRDKKLADAAKAGDEIARTQIDAANKMYNQYRQQTLGVPVTQEQPVMEGFEAEVAEPETISSPQGAMDKDVADAMRALAKRPDMKDEINRRLISVGKPPIP